MDGKVVGHVFNTAEQKKKSFGFKLAFLSLDLIKRFDGFHATNSVFFLNFCKLL